MDRVLIIIILFIVMYIDIKKMYIPNGVNLILMGLALYNKGSSFFSIENSLLGMGVYTLPLLLIYGYGSDLMKKEIFGFGDIKLLLSIGYILGYSDFYELYIYYMISFGLASVVGLVLYIFKRDRNRELPFSPYLIISFFYLWVVRI